jgi:hypothetical protein
MLSAAITEPEGNKGELLCLLGLPLKKLQDNRQQLTMITSRAIFFIRGKNKKYVSAKHTF